MKMEKKKERGRKDRKRKMHVKKGWWWGGMWATGALSNAARVSHHLQEQCGERRGG